MQTAIVIGGGPAGLAAGAHLAASGVHTTVLEARAILGGRAATEERDGLCLNRGPHALYAGGPARRELDALGIRLDSWNPASLTRSVFLRDGRVVRNPGGTAPFVRWLLRASRADPRGLAQTSTRDWLDATVGRGPARRAAEATVRTATFVADLDALSADVAARQVRLAVWPGVRYLRGGWQQLVDALAAAATKRGARLRTRAGVRALDAEAGAFTVSLDDEELHVDAVVLAGGGPAEAARLLGDRVSPVDAAGARRLSSGGADKERHGPAAAAVVSCLDLGLRSMPKTRRTFAPGLDRPTYFSLHSPPRQTSPRLLSLMSYAAEPRAALEDVADAVQPGWRDELLFARHLPRMVACSLIPTPATGGLAGRPRTDVAPGLCIAGDWVGPEGWLTDAALASGAAAARSLLAQPARSVAAA